MIVALFGIIAFIISVSYPKKIYRNNVIFFALIFSLFFVLSNLYTGNSDWAEILWIWGYIGIALLLINFKINYRVVGGVYYVVVFCFVSCYLRGISADNIITMGSRNTVSAIVLLYLFVYTILRYLQVRNVDLFSSIAALIVCFWGMGRAGILTSALFVVASILYNLFQHGYSKLRVIIITALIAIIGYYIATHYFDSAIKLAMARLDRMGMEDSARKNLYAAYIGDMKNIGNVLFGVPFGKNSLLFKYNNPHNSWLMLHAKYGLIPFTITLFYLGKAIVRYIQQKEWIVFIVIVLAILRCYLDWIAFNGLFDVLWWYMIVYVIAFRRVVYEEN